jgi:DNA-binding IclR family transcriptional regulator
MKTPSTPSTESLGDTAFLTIRNGTDSVCIDRRPGSFPVKVLSIEIGARRPLGVGVSGLVLLASLPADEAADLVRRNTRRLEALHVDPAELLERAVRTRAQGYAYAPLGVVPGSRAIAVPICLAGAQAAELAIRKSARRG